MTATITYLYGDSSIVGKIEYSSNILSINTTGLNSINLSSIIDLSLPSGSRFRLVGDNNQSLQLVYTTGISLLGSKADIPVTVVSSSGTFVVNKPVLVLVDRPEGVLTVENGGTGASTLSAGILTSNGSVISGGLAQPSGDLVGTTQTGQILSNKKLVDNSTIFINSVDNTKELKLDASALLANTSISIQSQTTGGRLVLSTAGQNVNFNNITGALQTFSLNAGLGNLRGDKLTFTSGDTWTNITDIVGSIKFNSATKANINIVTIGADVLVNTPMVLNPNGLGFTTNNLGRITCVDAFSWLVKVNYGISFDVATNNRTCRLSLYKNGALVSGSEITSTSGNTGRAFSCGGVEIVELAPTNYLELFVANLDTTDDVGIFTSFILVDADRLG